MTSATLRFEPLAHEYTLLSGQVVPSVTQILKATGVSVDFDEIAAMSRRRGEAIEAKRALGTAVHADAWALDDEDLEWATVHPDVLPYLRAWATFRENSGVVPLTRERLVHHPVLQYAGTLDGIFRTAAGRSILIDIKVGDPISAAAHLQTAAYEAAYLAEHPDLVIDQRWAVRLCPDMKVPYRITNYSARPEAWSDFRKFQSCVTVFYEQPAQRGVR